MDKQPTRPAKSQEMGNFTSLLTALTKVPREELAKEELKYERAKAKRTARRTK